MPAVLDRFGYQLGASTFCPSASTTARLSDADIIDICTELSSNRSVTSLDLSNATIGTEAAVALSKIVGRGTVLPLQHLRLADCNINANSLGVLAPALAHSPKLEIIDLTNNSVRDDGCDPLCQVIQHSTTLRVLTLNWCKIGPAGMRTLCTVLNAGRLRQLDLQGNKLRAAGCISLCEALATNSTVASLDLSANCINSEGGRSIAALLAANTTLESLKVGTNYLSDSAPHIAVACSARAAKSVTMRLLDLSNNRIDVASCRTMAQQLEGKRFSASCISFERNPVGDEGLVGLFHAVRGTAVQFLDLSECGLTQSSGVVIADLILSCKQLNSLQVDGNDLGDDALHEVFDALSQSSTLSALNLERTGISGRGIADLATVVSQRQASCGLRSLNLAENDRVDQASMTRLLEALSVQRALEDLDLSDLACIVEDETLLRLIVSLFETNPNLSRVLLERTPLAALLPPPGVLTPSVAHALIKATVTAEQAQKQQKSISRSGGIASIIEASVTNVSTSSSYAAAGRKSTPVVTAGIRGVSSLSQRAASSSVSPPKGALVVANASTNRSTALSKSSASPSSLLSERHVGDVNPSAIYRPNWALTVPVDNTPSPYIPPEDEPEDGRFPPLVPLKGSLHDPMYPGYGKGPLSNAVTLQSLNNPMPFQIGAAAATRRPFIPTCDGASLVAVPPKKPLKVSPYSLEALENNACFLPISDDQLRRKFSELDVDGNGYLDRSEFKKLYLTFPNYGVPHNEKQVDDLFRKYAGADQKLTFDEFCVLMLHVATR